jgi:hypothetical protein
MVLGGRSNRWISKNRFFVEDKRISKEETEMEECPGAHDGR